MFASGHSIGLSSIRRGLAFCSLISMEDNDQPVTVQTKKMVEAPNFSTQTQEIYRASLPLNCHVMIKVVSICRERCSTQSYIVEKEAIFAEWGGPSRVPKITGPIGSIKRRYHPDNWGMEFVSIDFDGHGGVVVTRNNSSPESPVPMEGSFHIITLEFEDFGRWINREIPSPLKNDSIV